MARDNGNGIQALGHAAKATAANEPAQARERGKRSNAPRGARLPVGAIAPQEGLVVVLGMHRSGSSAITKGLQTLGVNLGANLMPAATDNNNKGFFEDLDIYKFNEALLRKAQSAWHRLAPIDAELLTGPTYSSDRRTAAALLARKRTAGSLFGFKDPRTAVILPFWQCVFADAGVDVRYVVTVRNPLDIAASLEARDKFALTKSLMLWAKHMLMAATLTEGLQRIFVSYDATLADPLAQLERLATFLDLPSPVPTSAAVKEYCREFLSDELRHNAFGRRELERSGAAPKIVIDIEKALHLLATGADPSKASASLNALKNEFEAISPLLALADTWEAHRGEATRRAEAAETRLTEVNQSLAELQADYTKTVAIRSDVERNVEELTAALTKAKAEGQSLGEANQGLIERLKQTENLLTQSQLQLSERDKLLIEVQDQLTRLGDQKDELAGELARAKEEVKTASEALDGERAITSALKREIDSLALRAEQIEAASHTANSTIDDIRTALAASESREQILKLQLDLALEQARNLEADCTKLVREQTVLRERIAELEGVAVLAEETHKKTRNAFEEESRREQAALRSRIAELERIAALAEESSVKACDALESLAAEKQALALEYNDALVASRSLEDRIDAITAQATTAEAAYTSTALQLKNALEECDRRERALDIVRDQALAATRSVEVVTNALTEALTRATTAEALASKLGARAESAERLAEADRVELGKLGRALEVESAAARELEEKHAILGTQTRALQIELDTLKGQHARALDQLRAERERAEKNHSDVQSQLGAHREALSRLQGELESTLKERDAANATSTSLGQERDDAAAALRLSQEQVRAGSLQVSALRAEVDAAKRQSDSFQDEVKILQETLARMRAELDDAQNARRLALAEVEMCRAAASEAAEREHTLRTAQGELQNRLEEAHQQQARLSDELRDAKATVEQYRADMNLLVQTNSEAEEELRNHRRDLLLARSLVSELRQSTSWRLTAPLRFFAIAIRNPREGLRILSGKPARPGS